MHDHGYALRLGVRPLIRAPRVYHVFAELTVLYQILQLINRINTRAKALGYKLMIEHTFVIVWDILLRKFIFKYTVIHLKNNYYPPIVKIQTMSLQSPSPDFCEYRTPSQPSNPHQTFTTATHTHLYHPHSTTIVYNYRQSQERSPRWYTTSIIITY